jgi:hypothetical protein
VIPRTLQAVKEIGNGKTFSDLSPVEQSRVATRAQELKIARNGIPPVTDLKHAAAQIEAQAKPVFTGLVTCERGIVASAAKKARRPSVQIFSFFQIH